MAQRGVNVLSKAIYVVAAKRTPCGAFGGSFKGLSATELATVAAKAALASGNVPPSIIDSVIIGNQRLLPLGLATTTRFLPVCPVARSALTLPFAFAGATN